MNDRTEVAIVAAMEREIAPLVRGWDMILGPRYHYYERDKVLVVCGGIGFQCALDAAETVMTFRQPSVLISAGLAGSLRKSLPIGTVVLPTKVLRADGSSGFTIEGGSGTLISASSVANPAVKRELASRHDADVVDMEAAAVGQVAQASGVRFVAVKAISDELDFDLPPMDGYVDNNGKFETVRFALRAALNPSWWPKLMRLKKDSDVATEALCATLAKMASAADVESVMQTRQAS